MTVPDTPAGKIRWEKWGPAVALSLLLLFQGGGRVALAAGETTLLYLFDEGRANQIASGTGAIEDTSGKGYDGTPVAGPIYREDIPDSLCEGGLSLQFGGSDQTHVEIPGTEDGDFEFEGPFTLEAWVKRTGNLSTQSVPILSKWGTTSRRTGSYILGMWRDGRPVFALSTTGSDIVEASSPSPLDTQWHHLAGIFDGNSIQLVLDGEVVGRANFSGTIHKNDVLFNVGGYTNATEFFASFPGLIDEVRVSSRAVPLDELGFSSQIFPDGDEDCVPDARDNCPEEPNADQSDRDLDGIGDVCDCAADDASEPGEDGTCPACGISASVTGKRAHVPFLLLFLLPPLLLSRPLRAGVQTGRDRGTAHRAPCLDPFRFA
ncbi:MAG: LamG domain-containing protein, partial [Deltaproteobacteria bacterium]